MRQLLPLAPISPLIHGGAQPVESAETGDLGVQLVVEEGVGLAEGVDGVQEVVGGVVEGGEVGGGGERGRGVGVGDGRGGGGRGCGGHCWGRGGEVRS